VLQVGRSIGRSKDLVSPVRVVSRSTSYKVSIDTTNCHVSPRLLNLIDQIIRLSRSKTYVIIDRHQSWPQSTPRGECGGGGEHLQSVEPLPLRIIVRWTPLSLPATPRGKEEEGREMARVGWWSKGRRRAPRPARFKARPPSVSPVDRQKGAYESTTFTSRFSVWGLYRKITPPRRFRR
jgi:hypothetical protein